MVVVKTFDRMLGRIFDSVKVDDSRKSLEFSSEGLTVLFTPEPGQEFYIKDLVGDISDLENSPILLAEIVSRSIQDDESKTLLFYNFKTEKGSVTVTWGTQEESCYRRGVDVFFHYPR